MCSIGVDAKRSMKPSNGSSAVGFLRSIEMKGAHSLRSIPGRISTAPMSWSPSALAKEPNVAKLDRSSRRRVSFRKKKSPTTRTSAPPSTPHDPIHQGMQLGQCLLHGLVLDRIERSADSAP